MYDPKGSSPGDNGSDHGQATGSDETSDVDGDDMIEVTTDDASNGEGGDE